MSSLGCKALCIVIKLSSCMLAMKLRTILKVFVITRPGIEPRSPGPLVNTLPTRPMRSIFINQNLRQKMKNKIWKFESQMNHSIKVKRLIL